MTYVPIVTTPTQHQPSRQTRELADLLGRVIEEYEKAHPSVSGAEVRHALQLARSASSKTSGAPAMVAALAGGLAVMVGLGVLLFMRGEGGADFAPGAVAIAVAVIGVLALVIALRRNL